MNFIERREKYFGDVFKATGNPQKVNFTAMRKEADAIAEAEAEAILEYARNHPYQPKKYKCSKELKATINRIRKELGIKRSYKRKGCI